MKKIIKAYLDRIEENLGVIYLGEDESHKIDIPLEFLPDGITEGTRLKLTIDIDKKASENIGKEVEDIRKQLLDNS